MSKILVLIYNLLGKVFYLTIYQVLQYKKILSNNNYSRADHHL